MKCLLIPLLALLALPTAVKAEFYSQEEKDRFCNISYDSLNKNRYFRSLWRKECGQNSEVLRSNIKKELRIEKEKTEKSKSYWLVLILGDGGTDGSAAMEKIQMSSIEACKNEGEKWLKIRKTEDGKNSRFINDIGTSQSYICITGK